MVGVVVPAAGALASGCGDDSFTSFGADTPDGGDRTGFDPRFDFDGGTNGGGRDGGGGDAAPGPVPERCGGAPCANHTGSSTFIEQGAPADAPALFDAAMVQPDGTNPTQTPRIVYPSHETMFPINVSHIRHEWTAGGTNDLFKLTFIGPKTTVTVYTTQREWEPSDQQWDWIAESNRGNAVTFTVTGLSRSAPQQAWQSKAVTYHFSALEVEGAIYYWSTGSKGIMKALVSDRHPQKFYTDPSANDANTCVACHTLSRDGKRLAVGYDGEKLREVSVPGRVTLVPTTPGAERASSWTTFSPDGKKLLVAAKGVMTLVDADTGAPIGPNQGVVPLPPGARASHPDWSALGDKVVFTLATKGGDKEVEGGSIAIIPWVNEQWGTPTVIVPSAGGPDNNFFPVFSPDSKWIAYVNASGKSKDASTAKIRLVAATGGTPLELARLNHRVNNVDNVTNTGNSMPTWAPTTKPGVFWLAFSSIRAYASLRPPDAKLDQIWIAAIDPNNPDPGYAAFWAPFQSMPEGNHRAFWTHVEGEKQCGCVEICGDGLDNDCDGVADEAECSVCSAVEICGNGKDDNCDCVVDNCTGEICNDGIDNDGDGLVDSADPSCGPH
jgi:hypothetical protein